MVHPIRFEHGRIRERSLPGVPANVRVNGVICKHPSWPDVAVDMRYFARGIGREFKPDPGLYAEGEVLLKSVTIEAQPAGRSSRRRGPQSGRSASRSAFDTTLTGYFGAPVVRSKNGWGQAFPVSRQPITKRSTRR